jgi:hypothetical protein
MKKTIKYSICFMSLLGATSSFAWTKAYCVDNFGISTMYACCTTAQHQTFWMKGENRYSSIVGVCSYKSSTVAHQCDKSTAVRDDMIRTKIPAYCDLYQF